jgi:hypothetical protein
MQLATDAFVDHLGSALARSLRTQIGPEISTIVARSVNESLAALFSAENQQRAREFAKLRANLLRFLPCRQQLSGQHLRRDRFRFPLVALPGGRCCLRFQLDDETRESLKYGVPLSIGVDHPEYSAAQEPVGPQVRASMVGDLA